MIPSVSTWSAHKQLLSGELSAADFLHLIKKEGAQGVEIVDIDFPTLETVRAFANEAARQNIQITCMSIEHSLCRMLEADRKADVAHVCEWMRLSKELGVRNVRVFTGWMENEAPYRVQLAWVYDGMRQLTEEAERLGIDLVLENHDNVCLAADEILALMVSLRSPRFFTCPDVFNYKTLADKHVPVIGDGSFAEIEPLIPFARNAHLKICEAVQGDTADRYLDIPRMMKLLRKHHYDGPVALEYMWPYLSEDSDATEGLRAAVRVLCHNINRNED